MANEASGKWRCYGGNEAMPSIDHEAMTGKACVPRAAAFEASVGSAHAAQRGPTRRAFCAGGASAWAIGVATAGLGALGAAPAGAVSVGQRAPAFSLPGLDGDVSLEALGGKVVLLDFWASWCAPCRLSFPWMSAMQARHGPAGLRVVAVNVDRQRAAADAFLRAIQPRMSTPLTIVFDPAGETPERYGAKAMPTSVLIGADQRVLLLHAGFRDDDKPGLEAALAAALAAARAAR